MSYILPKEERASCLINLGPIERHLNPCAVLEKVTDIEIVEVSFVQASIR